MNPMKVRWGWHRGHINGWTSITKRSFILGNLKLRCDKENDTVKPYNVSLKNSFVLYNITLDYI